MLLAFLLALWLRKARAIDLVALRRGLIAFNVGEGFCALNFLLFGEGSYLIEYLHALGMVLAFGFTSQALFEAFDHRLLKVSAPDKRCAALALCNACTKRDPAAPCTVQRLALDLIPLAALVALMPLTAALHESAYHTTILGTPYTHLHPTLFQIFELRYAPSAAALLFAAAYVVLRFTRHDPVPLTKALFAHGLGFLGFGLFRFVIFGVYRDEMAFYDLWEELLYIAGAGLILWRFRARLFTLPVVA